MPPTDKVLIAFYDGWENYQKQLTKAVTQLTPELLTTHVTPDLRTIGQILTHLIAVRVRWFHEAAGAGGSDVAPIGTWDRPDSPPHTLAELVAGLETSWQLIRHALDTWTPDELSTPYELVLVYHPEKETFTRQWIVWHVIEHDLHHGGELSLALGINHLPGIDI